MTGRIIKYHFSRTIKTCFKYDGKGDTPNDLEFKLTYNLDLLASQPRAHFIDREIVSDWNMLSKDYHSSFVV